MRYQLLFGLIGLLVSWSANGATELTCLDLFSRSQVDAHLDPRTPVPSWGTGPHRNVIRAILTSQFIEASNHSVTRIDALLSLIPQLTADTLADVDVGGSVEEFVADLVKTLTSHHGPQLADQLLGQAILRQPQATTASRSAEVFVGESITWLNDLYAYRTDAQSLEPGPRRKAARLLLQPYLGVTPQGRVAILQWLKLNGVSIPAHSVVLHQANATYTFELLKWIYQTQNKPDEIILRILALLEYQHLYATQIDGIPNIRSWTDWTP